MPEGDVATMTPPWTHLLARALLFGGAYYALGRLGLMTVVEDRPVALVAPATGVGIVWASTATRRSLPWDAASVALASLLLSAALDLPTWIVLVAPLVTWAQLATFVVIARRLAPDLAPFGGERTSWTLRDLVGFIAAAAVATFISSALSTGLQAAEGLPTGDALTFMARWARSGAAVVTIGAAGLIGVATLRSFGGRGGPSSVVDAVSHWSPAKIAEGIALGIASIAVYVAVFTVFEDYPLAFVLFLVTGWAGARFSPLATAVHSVMVGTLAVQFTLAGNGSFAVNVDPLRVALLAQSFVIIISVSGLALALTRWQLVAAEGVAEQRGRLFYDVLDNVADGVFVLDQRGALVFANRVARETTVDREAMADFEDQRPYDLFFPDGSPVLLEQTPYMRALSGDTVLAEEFTMRWRDDRPPTVVRLNAHLIPPTLRRDDALVLVSFHDVTADHERRDALAKFAGHVAHDLQNPLTIVATWTEAMRSVFDSEGEMMADEGLRSTDRILAATKRMSDFIHELLDFTVARDQALKPVDVDLRAVVEDVATFRRGPDEAPQASIVIEGDAVAKADAQLTRIVIDNLVSNAVKYVAPDVAPRIVVELASSDPDWVTVSVIDNGIGIAEEARRQIFDSFVRLDAGGYVGTGLGLGICHRIVSRHGGAITVDGVSGGGSRVSFTLPAATSSAPRDEVGSHRVA